MTYGYTGHGTACAGIIGAESVNNQGIAGINPGGQLMAISNDFFDPGNNQQLADGINKAWQNGAAVISCSWKTSTQSPLIDDAIDSALTYGRNGKGCVVVFSSGNSNSDVIYPANSNPDILAVGAISSCGERCNPNSCYTENWGSNYGDELDIVAPGVLIPTTDIVGSDGYYDVLPIHTDPSIGGTLLSSDYDDKDYTVWFSGTSSACPHVAGVAGLMLSDNNALTHKDVAKIIEGTARKINTDEYTYETTAGRPNGTWNEEMGYGLIDAYCAVLNASPLWLAGSISEDTYKRYFIYVDDAIIEDNENVTLLFGKEVHIVGTFEVEKGATCEINVTNEFSCQ